MLPENVKIQLVCGSSASESATGAGFALALSRSQNTGRPSAVTNEPPSSLTRRRKGAGSAAAIPTIMSPTSRVLEIPHIVGLWWLRLQADTPRAEFCAWGLGRSVIGSISRFVSTLHLFRADAEQALFRANEELSLRNRDGRLHLLTQWILG